MEDEDKLWTIDDVILPEIPHQFVPSQEKLSSSGFANSARLAQKGARALEAM